MSSHNQKILWASFDKAQELACMQMAIDDDDFEGAMYHQMAFLQAHDEHAALLHGKRGAMQTHLNFILAVHGLKQP